MGQVESKINKVKDFTYPFICYLTYEFEIICYLTLIEPIRN